MAGLVTHLLVVGGNAAGMSAASKARRRRPDLEVTVLEAGLNISYSSCGIPYYAEGVVEDPAELLVLSQEDAAERGITVRTRTRATGFNPYTKRVSVDGGGGRDDIGYDKLLIATGTTAVNPFPGGDLDGVFTLRHIGDGVRMMRHIESTKAKRVGIVGGGFIGLEMAEAFLRRGLKVHLFQRGDRLMTSMDPDMTLGLDQILQANGVQVHLDAGVRGFGERSPDAAGKAKGKGKSAAGSAGAGDEGGSPRVGSVLAKEDVDVDAVVVGVGVRPNTDWTLKGTGLETTKDGYILVDTQMKTNLHDVYAAGDCVAAPHAITERPTPVPLALPANRMGKVAGDTIAASLGDIPGQAMHFGGVMGTSITRAFGLALAQTGVTEQEAKGIDMDVATYLLEARNKAGYMPDVGDMAVKLVANADNGRLVGCQLIGPMESGLRINAAAVAIKAKLTVKQLAEVETAYSPPFSPVYDPLITAASELAKEMRK